MKVYVSESRLFSSDFYKKSLEKLKEKRLHLKERLELAVKKEKENKHAGKTVAPAPVAAGKKVAPAPVAGKKVAAAKPVVQTKPAVKKAGTVKAKQDPKTAINNLKFKIATIAKRLADAKNSGDEKKIKRARELLIPLRQKFERAYYASQK